MPSVYAVSDFAEATIGAAGVAGAHAMGVADVQVDRRRASLWFDMTVQPDGWETPSIWDAIAGVYKARDGWIRLHTNAPHHRDAALSVLQVSANREAVGRAVGTWSAEALETSIVDASGCAARLMSEAEWASHPQGRALAAEPLIHWKQREAHKKAPMNVGSLKGIRVLDLTRVLAGPVATRLMAGFGADVLRIDPPWWNEPAAELEVTLGKRCAGLDLRLTADRDVLAELMRHADIVVHGYRADALETIGFGKDVRRALNPDLIDVSLNAYGWTGPWKTRRGFDSLVQMSCGIAHRGMIETGVGKPVPLPVQALDHGTGYLAAACALRALKARQEGRVLSARVSLARTAELLKARPKNSMSEPGVTLCGSDLAGDMEETDWGPAYRVAPPATINGQGPKWGRGAGKLRRHTAKW